MGFASRAVLSLVLIVSSLTASAAKLPEGTQCEVKKPAALFKKPKGKKRLGKLAKGETFVIKAKKGRRFAVVMADGREGFIGPKMAHRFCEQPDTSVVEACITEDELPLFKKPKGKKRIGKVSKGSRIDLGKAFRYRKGYLAVARKDSFLKRSTALCIRAPIVPLKNGQPATPAEPATQATPATQAKPATPAAPGTPAQPATPGKPAAASAATGGPTPPSVSAPGMTVPVVSIPTVPGTAVPAPSVPSPRASFTRDKTTGCDCFEPPVLRHLTMHRAGEGEGSEAG